MAAPMIPPAAAPAFLAASGWDGADILPLAGDASFRRYFRVVRGDARAVLMDAPPEHEDVGPFIAVADHLCGLGFRAPRVMARDLAAGLLLLEDFGDDRLGPYLLRAPDRERALYEDAIALLARLHRAPPPAGLAAYDRDTLLREAALFPEWYAPALGIAADAAGFRAAWDAALAGLEGEAGRAVLTLRDYHADNLMVLGDGTLGLLDFQDALAGHPAYDLVSLLQDARRDVAPALEKAMIAYYADLAGIADLPGFRAAYELLGAQRNTKILGIFTRLWRRDGKRHYLPLQPRVWSHLERNLAHPALAPVRAWFDAHVPVEKRGDAWRGADAA